MNFSFCHIWKKILVGNSGFLPWARASENNYFQTDGTFIGWGSWERKEEEQKRRERDRETEAERQTDRQTGRQTDRQRERERETHNLSNLRHLPFSKLWQWRSRCIGLWNRRQQWRTHHRKPPLEVAFCCAHRAVCYANDPHRGHPARFWLFPGTP